MGLKAMSPSITRPVNEYQWAESRCATFEAATGETSFKDSDFHHVSAKIVIAKVSARCEEENLCRTIALISLLVHCSTEDLYLQGPKQVGPVPPETFFKKS